MFNNRENTLIEFSSNAWPPPMVTDLNLMGSFSKQESNEPCNPTRFHLRSLSLQLKLLVGSPLPNYEQHQIQLIVFL
jgi:hypothetical protein